MDTRFRFHNFASLGAPNDALSPDGWISQFDHAALIRFLLAIRVPHGAPLLQRASGGERLLAFTKHKSVALIGVRIADGIPSIVAKFSYRVNLPSWRIIRRPCICAKNISLAQPFFPIHVIWEWVRRRTPLANSAPQLCQNEIPSRFRNMFPKKLLSPTHNSSLLTVSVAGRRKPLRIAMRHPSS